MPTSIGLAGGPDPSALYKPQRGCPRSLDFWGPGMAALILHWITNGKSAWRLESRELPVPANRRCHGRLPLPVLEFCPNLLSPLPTSRPESFKRAISVSEAVALQSAVGVPLSYEHSWQSP